MYQGTVTVRFTAKDEREAEHLAQRIREVVEQASDIEGVECDEDIWEAGE